MSDNYREPDSESPFSYMLEEALNGQLRGLMVSLPGRIMAFDPATQRAQVQCGIRRIINGTPATIPVITGVPVQFSGDNEWFFYHQITPGETEGLVHFSQRAIDTWMNSGGVQTPVDFRMFSAKDAMFSPGYRSEPGAIPNFVNNGCGLSNYTGNVKLQLTDNGITATVGGTVLTLDENGFNVNGTSFTHNGTNVGDTHVHPITGGSSAPGPTGEPE